MDLEWQDSNSIQNETLIFVNIPPSWDLFNYTFYWHFGRLTSIDSHSSKLSYKLPASSQASERPRMREVTCQLPPCTQQAPSSPSPRHLASHIEPPASYPRNKGGKTHENPITSKDGHIQRYTTIRVLSIPTHTPASASSALSATARW